MLNAIMWVLLGTGIALVWTDKGFIGVILIVLAVIVGITNRRKSRNK